jgi:hypothetical protein
MTTVDVRPDTILKSLARIAGVLSEAPFDICVKISATLAIANWTMKNAVTPRAGSCARASSATS